MKIYLAKYRGFCVGVKRSIRMAQKAREEISGPIHILNEIVHNSAVIKSLEDQGLARVQSALEISEGTLIISAQGAPPGIIDGAQARGLNVIDTTCPLVKVIHRAAKNFIGNGYKVILYGDPNHGEVRGIQGIDPDNIYILNSVNDIGRLPEFDGNVAFISQSTRSYKDFQATAEKIRERFENLQVKNTICHATIRRQTAIYRMAKLAALILVVGSPMSANSRQLVQTAEELGARSHLIENAAELDHRWLDGLNAIGLTSGASTPETLVDDALKKIMQIVEKKDMSAELIEV